jgi:hypothetical protein
VLPGGSPLSRVPAAAPCGVPQVDDNEVALVKRGDLQSNMMSLDQIHRSLQPRF